MFFFFRWFHLLFNLLVQLLVGLPLEMVHGSLRIGIVYMAGVLAGDLPVFYSFNSKLIFIFLNFFLLKLTSCYQLRLYRIFSQVLDAG